MAALPLDVEPAHRPSTLACGHCLHMLHGPVAFCPYCGQAAGSAQVPAARAQAPAPAPAPVPVLVSPSPSLADETALRPSGSGASLPPAPRPGDPQAAARRLVTALAALVVALAGVIAWLAFFDAPPEPAAARAPGGPTEASGQEPPTGSPQSPAPAPPSPSRATAAGPVPPLVPLTPTRVRAPPAASSSSSETAPPASAPGPVPAAAPPPETASAVLPATAPEPPPGTDAVPAPPGAAPGAACPGALAALSLCAPPGR